MTAVQTSVAITEPNQAGEARRVAIRVAESIALDEQARGEVAIVASELATNLARYATNGRLFIRALAPSGGVGVELLAVDGGPGIADVQRCLQDGYSTGGGTGTGLGAVRRLSTTFDLYSTVGSGTAIVSRVARTLPGAPPGGPAFEWAAVSTPAPHETVCGDAWRVAERGGRISIMVADGLGHGPLASHASEKAGAVFDDGQFESATVVVERAHRALSGSRGAAIAIAQVAAGGQVSYCGVGNISGTLLGQERGRGMASQNGTIGVQIRKPQAFDYEWPSGGLLVMHSDGLSGRWSLDTYPGLAIRHPAVVAGVLWRDFGRGRDDATVLVVRRSRAGGDV